MHKLIHARRKTTEAAVAMPESASEPRWAPWLLALMIYAIYAVIASPALASMI